MCLGGVSSQHDWHPHRKETFGRENPHTGRAPREDARKTEGDAVEAKEHQRLAANCQKLAEGHRTDSPS